MWVGALIYSSCSMAFYRLDIMGFARFEPKIPSAFAAILVIGFLNLRPSRFHRLIV
jgi:hypothetical protein